MEEQLLTKKQRREQKRQEKLEKQLGQEKQKRKRTITTWSIVALIIIGVVAVLIFASNSPKINLSGMALVDQVTNNDWIKGNKDAKVTIVEYSDFECPACSMYAGAIKKLLGTYKDDVRFVYRHYPLNYHKSAILAAYAAEAAGKQGKFFDMHDLIFQKQNEWSGGRANQIYFENLAKQLKLDIEKFKTDYNSAETKKAVKEDVDSGNKNNIQATPTIFVNGKSVKVVNYGELESLVKSLIK
jgi:protein-disulfide isomerase